jgi:hypothetical protein
MGKAMKTLFLFRIMSIDILFTRIIITAVSFKAKHLSATPARGGKLKSRCAASSESARQALNGKRPSNDATTLLYHF